MVYFDFVFYQTRRKMSIIIDLERNQRFLTGQTIPYQFAKA